MKTNFLIYKYAKDFLDDDILDKKYFVYNDERLKVKVLKKILNFFLTKYIIQHQIHFRLHSKLMKKLYTNRYKKYLSYLIENELIYISDNYSVGVKTYQYSLTNKLTNIIGNPNFKVDAVLDNSDESKSFIIDNLYKFNIDSIGAIKWLENNKNISIRSKKINLFTLNNFNNNVFYNFDTNGRLHTKYTILKKEIRQQFIKFNNEKVKEIDIANSQPLFLNYLMYKNDIYDIDFKSDVLNGNLYHRISEILNISRDEAKIYTFKVLFGKNSSKDNAFKKLYPITYSFLLRYKKNDYKKLANKLQQIESNFMYNNVCKALNNNNIEFITIHDSIIVPERKYYISKLIFSKLLEEIKK